MYHHSSLLRLLISGPTKKKKTANTSQEHHTMTNDKTGVTRNTRKTILLEILLILRRSMCNYINAGLLLNMNNFLVLKRRTLEYDVII